MDHNDNELLRPNFHLSAQTLSLSRSTWHALVSSAQYATSLPYRCSNIKALLNQTPSIPQSTEATECAGKKSLFLEGYSTWSISPPGKISNHTCELPPVKKTLSRKVYIGQSRPSTCNFSEDDVPEWTGYQPIPEPVGNYLSVFVLGWSYVLSARLIELRRTTIKDKGILSSTLKLMISLKFNGGQQYLPGGGWQATLARDGNEYYAPWECHLTSSLFRLHHRAQIPASLSTLKPPSAAEAQQSS